MEIKKRDGQVIILALVFLGMVTATAIYLNSFVFSGEKVVRFTNDSLVALNAAEAGLEKALVCLNSADDAKCGGNAGGDYPGESGVVVGDGRFTSTVAISGADRVINVTGTGRESGKRKIRATATAAPASDTVSFNFAMQVGAGGVVMDSNTEVNGTLYSNGPVVGAGTSEIYGDVYSTGASGLIDNVKTIRPFATSTAGNAYAHTIKNSNIANGAYYQVIQNTTASSLFPGSPDPAPEGFAITQSLIDNWKNNALAGGAEAGFSLSGGQSRTIGPKKITGNVSVSGSNAVLVVSGTLWITGNLTLGSNSILHLDSSYGSNGGIVIVDGQILIDSNVLVCGSAGFQTSPTKCKPANGSLILLLSTNTSLSDASPAISVSSNVSGFTIIYANYGLAVLNSNMEAQEITAYKIHLNSNSEIEYNQGLANIQFTSGPGGSFQLKKGTWQEIK